MTTLPSSIKSSRALWHISRTWASGIGLHARSCAIALERDIGQLQSWRPSSRSWPAGPGGILVEIAHCRDPGEACVVRELVADGRPEKT